MRKINDILFATDLSTASLPAAEYALTLAKLAGANLHVLHVINELDEHQRVMIPSEAFKVLEKTIELQAVTELDRFCRERAADLATTTYAVVGTPFLMILETGEKVNADLIVMGTHGRNGVERVIVGSTAERVVRRSKIPVLTVRSVN
ncbi:MAG: universal stress protein [Desulfuromonadales bacterium]|nr:universal stress protein [Desulfuromonadales bacterium]